MLEIRAQEQVAADDIVAVRVETFAQTLALNNDLVPPTLEAAQYSVPFCVAAAAVHGPQALLPLEEAALADRAVLACAPKIAVTVDPALDPLFPAAVPARVIVETRDARFSRTIVAPRGEPSNPLGWDELRAKFETLAENRLPTRATAGLIDAVAALDHSDLRPLLSALPARSEAARPPQSALVPEPAGG
jgi:2-methylcitrate dehydratase PrpD